MVQKFIYKLISLIIFVISVFAIFYLYNKPSSPPEIKIMVNDQTIDWVVGLNEWNRAKYDREDNFKVIMGKNSKIQIPYIPLDSTINISFTKKPPKKVQLMDYILNSDGSVKYQQMHQEIPIAFEKGKGSFKLNMNNAVYLSSDLNYYEPGNTIRGFKLTCNWGNNECEYAFIIKTDAK